MPAPEVVICVLTYNRPAFLRDALRSILAQTWRDFRVVVLDNASSASYESVLAEFQEERLTYVRHEKNLGSWGNFAYARKHFATARFFMIFHDDDVMHPELIERQVTLLRKKPTLRWVSCLTHSFTGLPPKFSEKVDEKVRTFHSNAELADALVGGFQLSFGGVLYRSDAIGAVDVDRLFEECSIIADRPLLMQAMRIGDSAVLMGSFLLYREHPAQDSRTGPLRAQHLIGLMKHYRSALVGTAARWRFRVSCAYKLPDSYFRLQADTRPKFWSFIRACTRAKVLDWWLLPWFPIRRFLGWAVQKLRRHGFTLLPEAFASRVISACGPKFS